MRALKAEGEKRIKSGMKFYRGGNHKKKTYHLAIKCLHKAHKYSGHMLIYKKKSCGGFGSETVGNSETVN